MSLSAAIETFLDQSHTPFDILEHKPTSNSLQTARAANVAAAELAKAVVVKDGDQYLMCVLPASHRLVLKWLDEDRQSHCRLATEDELRELFPDCELGAIPGLGQAYDMPVIWDNSLNQVHHVYIEAGDHRRLIHLRRDQFMDLMAEAEHATIGCEPEMLDMYRDIH